MLKDQMIVSKRFVKMMNKSYRGLTKDGHLIYGSYLYDEKNDKHYIITNNATVKHDMHSTYIIDSMYEVTKDSISEFTNINDSDGVPIYENDSVETNHNDKKIEGVVKKAPNGAWTLYKDYFYTLAIYDVRNRLHVKQSTST
jgi:hypothetical protein